MPLRIATPLRATPFLVLLFDGVRDRACFMSYVLIYVRNDQGQEYLTRLSPACSTTDCRSTPPLRRTAPCQPPRPTGPLWQADLPLRRRSGPSRCLRRRHVPRWTHRTDHSAPPVAPDHPTLDPQLPALVGGRREGLRDQSRTPTSAPYSDRAVSEHSEDSAGAWPKPSTRRRRAPIMRIVLNILARLGRRLRIAASPRTAQAPVPSSRKPRRRRSRAPKPPAGHVAPAAPLRPTLASQPHRSSRSNAKLPSSFVPRCVKPCSTSSTSWPPHRPSC